MAEAGGGRMGAKRLTSVFAVAGALGVAGAVAVVLAVVLALPGGAQPAPDVAQGEAVYDHWCAPCHAPGPGHPGTQSLQIKYGGDRSPVLLERTDLSPDAVALFVRQGVLLMAPFRKTEITDAELGALKAYVAQNYEAP